jgi:hypothetical protein
MDVATFFATRPTFVDPWFAARDMLLGWNGAVRNTATAVFLAETSTHPDAVWFCHAACNNINRPINKCFFWAMYQRDKTDVRALYFTAVFPHRFAWENNTGVPFIGNGDALDIAANAGYFPALVDLSRNFTFEDAVASGDPHAIWLAASRAADINDRFPYLQVAAQYGVMNAIEKVHHRTKDKCDPFKYVMFLLASKKVLFCNFEYLAKHTLVAMVRAIRKFLVKRKRKYGPAVYWIGKCLLEGNFDEKKLTFGDRNCIYGLTREGSHSLVAAIDHYQVTVENAQLSVHVWCATAKRLGMVKDIRQLIAKRVWHERHLLATKLDDDYQEKDEEPKHKRKK